MNKRLPWQRYSNQLPARVGRCHVGRKEAGDGIRLLYRQRWRLRPLAAAGIVQAGFPEVSTRISETDDKTTTNRQKKPICSVWSGLELPSVGVGLGSTFRFLGGRTKKKQAVGVPAPAPANVPFLKLTRPHRCVHHISGRVTLLRRARPKLGLTHPQQFCCFPVWLRRLSNTATRQAPVIERGDACVNANLVAHTVHRPAFLLLKVWRVHTVEVRHFDCVAALRCGDVPS